MGSAHPATDTQQHGKCRRTFFGAVDSLDRALATAHAAARAVVLRLGHVPFIDATGLQSLSQAMRGLAQCGDA
jgi:SulP family sulfate permease